MIRNLLAAGLIGLLAFSRPVAATPIAYSAGFANPAVVLDFSGLAEGTVIGSTYASQGVTFTGLYATSFYGNSFAPATAPSAVNFSGNTTNAVFTIGFAAPVHDVVFYLYTDGYGTSITSSLRGQLVESTFAGSYNNSGLDYFGFSGSTFDSITINVSGSGNAIIDNVEVGVNNVAEPASMGVMLLGLTGLAAARRRAGKAQAATVTSPA